MRLRQISLHLHRGGYVWCLLAACLGVYSIALISENKIGHPRLASFSLAFAILTLVFAIIICAVIKYSLRQAFSAFEVASAQDLASRAAPGLSCLHIIGAASFFFWFVVVVLALGSTAELPDDRDRLFVAISQGIHLVVALVHGLVVFRISRNDIKKMTSVGVPNAVQPAVPGGEQGGIPMQHIPAVPGGEQGGIPLQRVPTDPVRKRNRRAMQQLQADLLIEDVESYVQ